MFLAAAVYADGPIIRPTLTVGGASESFRILAKKAELFNRMPVERSSVKVDCNENIITFTIEMDDNDLLCEAVNDQDNLKDLGDAIQIFLKSEKETFLWEFQIAPNGKKSCFFHLGAGRMFYPANAAAYDFTVNNTVSKGKWIMTAAIPLTIFKEKGLKFTNDEKWTFVAVRHNFSRFFNAREISSYPQTVNNTANTDFFGSLILK